jgi:hypothetical protein
MGGLLLLRYAREVRALVRRRSNFRLPSRHGRFPIHNRHPQLFA